ncbi:SDR family NAD(P)-dependent oxidoreductase [Deinococcus sp. HMF7620]|uniref:SDR family NAD(P)-dependent oxidoreductase n=1 Tax=Deinococcus arboris TaxID=2682977 RepID=A0A7C9LL07_9DEIO|nr:SDR family oxidoreductase [Deinococcus arboris]MVN87098.1 SDR family NAD(P)-dependent oxidoreductase [Deinococcus arboris]
MTTEGKVILITGTSSGVGLHTALELAAGGHHVYATMRNPERAGVLRQLAEEHGVTVHVRTLDVQQDDSVRACVQGIVAETGRLDVLVNNAGAGLVRATEQASDEDVQQVLDLNLLGVIRCVRAVLPVMRSAGHGQIVNVTSVGGLVGQPLNDLYCAAKFAVEGLSESLASYLEPYFGIRVQVVEPGAIATNFLSTVLAGLEESPGPLDEVYRPVLDDYLAPMVTLMEQARAGGGPVAVGQTPQEVAQVIARVVSGEITAFRTRTSASGEAFTALKTSGDPTGDALLTLVRQRFLNR